MENQRDLHQKETDQTGSDVLDTEWLSLIGQARMLGLSKNDVLLFLRHKLSPLQAQRDG